MRALIPFILLIAGCTGSDPALVDVHFELLAMSPKGAPVAGARLVVDGETVGASDADGIWRGRRAVAEGVELQFDVDAPAGHRLAQPRALERWRHVVRQPGRGGPLTLTFDALMAADPSE